ncbi:sugar ABC transporter permease [Spirochaetia bacterium]|nr:sugar ABC transporter permease [Spirochaetia bacterium]
MTSMKRQWYGWRRRFSKMFTYLFLVALGLVMIYPLIWLFFSSFKPNSEIFGSPKLLPDEWVLDSYAKGWEGSGQFTFTTFLWNTIKMVGPTTFFTVLSGLLVGYGFARFNFTGKKFFFYLMISTLMLPNTVIIIPRYILFRNFGWLNTYLPFIVPAIFAGYPFFVYLMIQFIRGIPRDLDDAAKIDGCNSFMILVRILTPLAKPAIFSVIIFQSLWTWNDFFNTLIYINSVRNYPVSLALRMCLDTASRIEWNAVLAMSLVCMIPCAILFFAAQKYFVEGVATTGLKA